MKTKFKLIFAVAVLMAVFMSSCDKDVALNGIVLDQVTATVMVGNTLNLNVIFDPIDASNKKVTWSSDDESISTVADGVVTGVDLGTVNIKVVSQEDPMIEAVCEVTVLPSNGQQITVSGDITTDTKWYANARYFLSGFVYVKSGATLTIESGTIIKGISGTKGALIVERGGKIMAQGTSTNPIVFTSDQPKGSRGYGDWGGVVLCGKATTNKHDTQAGEGIAEGGIGSLYGGNNDADNSGILEYVRIEFPGIGLTSTANSEINGLTLYAVGSGTTIDHIQVSYSGDDSYEWFGGTVNMKYLVAFRGWDDDYDTDNGFRGKIQFALGIRDPLSADQSGSNGFESDNDADGSTLTPTTAPVFSNVTLYGPYAVSANANSLFKRAMHLRRSTQLSVYNSVFVGWPVGLLLDGTVGNTPTMADNNTLQIQKVILAGMAANFAQVSASDNPAVPYTIAQAQAYFEATNPARGNSDSQLVTDILGASPLSLTAPSLLPSAGNILLTSGASYTPTKLSDAFFDKTPTFIGAFGSTNWTTGWCNFDPQNTDY
jgi:hypothetical protein